MFSIQLSCIRVTRTQLRYWNREWKRKRKRKRKRRDVRKPSRDRLVEEVPNPIHPAGLIRRGIHGVAPVIDLCSVRRIPLSPSPPIIYIPVTLGVPARSWLARTRNRRTGHPAVTLTWLRRSLIDPLVRLPVLANRWGVRGTLRRLRTRNDISARVVARRR